MGHAPTQLTKPPMPQTKPPTQGTSIPLVCPRCTAPYDGRHCEYCGTNFVWVYREENAGDCSTEPYEAEVTEYNHLQYSGTSKKEERRTMSEFAKEFARVAASVGIDL